MGADRLHNFGPPLTVESWVEEGQRRGWLAGGGGDVAHLVISHDPYLEERWVRDYATGREAFCEPRIEAARDFVDGAPARAVVSARIARDIPWRGAEFLANQGRVVRAMGTEDPLEQLLPGSSSGEIDQDAVLDALCASLRQMSRAMVAAFGDPSVERELDDIIQKAREAIPGDGIDVWMEAANSFSAGNDPHATGVAVTELGGAYERRGMPGEALGSYAAAGKVLKYRLREVASQEAPDLRTAEVDTLITHVVEAQSGVHAVLRTGGPVSGTDKELLKNAVYDLDDLGAPLLDVMEGYQMLARSSHFRERRFYDGEARGIAGDIEVAAFFEQNPHSVLIGGFGRRRDRKHLRPPVITD